MHNFMKVNLGENWAFNVAGNSAKSFSDVIDFTIQRLLAEIVFSY